MRKIDLLWQSDPDQWEFRDGDPVLMDDAPQEAKESFARCSKQMTQACERNIAYDWKEDFAPQILARGKEYFEEGKLRRIRRCGDTYIADVKGGNVYRVEIDVADGEVVHMGCDCPYTVEWGENCKHMAAVLYALEAGHPVTVETVPVRKRPVIVEHRAIELPWLEAIDHLPESVVRRKLMQLADRDDGLKERLAVLYLGGLPEGQLTNWKADLQGLAFGACDRHGKMRYEQAEDFFFDLKMFLSGKLPMLLEAKAHLDAVKTVWIVLETAMEQTYDEPDGSLWELKGKCEEYWGTIFRAADERVRQEMLDWFWSVRHDIDQSYGVDGIEVDYFFLTLPWNEQQHRANLERLAQEIENMEDDGSKHTELRSIRDRIVELLKC